MEASHVWAIKDRPGMPSASSSGHKDGPQVKLAGLLCPLPFPARSSGQADAPSGVNVSPLRPVTDEGNTSPAPQSLAESFQRRRRASRAENARGISATAFDGVPQNCYGLNRKPDVVLVLDAEQLASPI